jgi:hypothetical protein
MVIRPDASKPMSRRAACAAPRASRTASTSSTIEAAACAPTRTARCRFDPVEWPLDLLFVGQRASRSAPFRWGEPGAEAGEDRDETEKRVGAAIGPDVERIGNADHAGQDRQQPHGEQQAQRPRDQAERQAFGQELANDTSPAGTERDSQTDLRPSCDGAREQQVRDICAGQDEHEPDCREHDHDDQRDLTGVLAASSGERVKPDAGHRLRGCGRVLAAGTGAD